MPQSTGWSDPGAGVVVSGSAEANAPVLSFLEKQNFKPCVTDDHGAPRWAAGRGERGPMSAWSSGQQRGSDQGWGLTTQQNSAGGGGHKAQPEPESQSRTPAIDLLLHSVTHPHCYPSDLVITGSSCLLCPPIMLIKRL